MINLKKFIYIFLITAVVIIAGFNIIKFGVIYYLEHSESTDYSVINAQNVILDGNGFSADFFYPSSAIGFTRYTYEIEGNNLYLTIYSGFSSKERFANGDLYIRINDEALSKVEKVYLKDRKNTKLIYEKNEEHLTDTNKTAD